MMEAAKPSPVSRPGHKRNASSKSNILRSLVSQKPRPEDSASRPPTATRTIPVPILPTDHPHAARGRVLGERQANAQSPPSSPSKSRQRAPTATKLKETTTAIPTKSKDGVSFAKKSKSSTNLSAMFSKMNRSSKDLSVMVQKDKENTTPPQSSSGPADTPIWAHFASTNIGKPSSRPSTRDSKSSNNLAEEIARYTPREYSPSKQRNFNGSFDQPALRPTLNSRPQSAYILGSEGLAALGRRVSGHRASIEVRRSEDAGRRLSRDSGRRGSGDRVVPDKRSSTAVANSGQERKVSGSSTEQPPNKEKIDVKKRGGRVMAAVAAFQGRGRSEEKTKKTDELDAKAVDEAFEAVLDSRQIPEPMRQKMRSLTLRVKADFIKQDQGLKAAGSSPPGTLTTATNEAQAPAAATHRSPTDETQNESTKKATKRSRSRPRSRTFTFSKGDKRSCDESPSKKERSRSKSRPVSIHIPSDGEVKSSSTVTPTSPFGSFGRKSATPAIPADYIKYLQSHQDCTRVEVGRLHKLRILLRNETVAWVDSFLSLNGMREIVSLLRRLMAIEWREEHEDQLLHETLLCLKGLCTTDKAMHELDKVANELFPALLGMLFDEEKKGPAEYATRTVIVNVLCMSSFLSFNTDNMLTTSSQFPCGSHKCFNSRARTTRATDPRLPWGAAKG
jgi:hypothetical protein